MQPTPKPKQNKSQKGPFPSLIFTFNPPLPSAYLHTTIPVEPVGEDHEDAASDSCLSSAHVGRVDHELAVDVDPLPLVHVAPVDNVPLQVLGGVGG